MLEVAETLADGFCLGVGINERRAGPGIDVYGLASAFGAHVEVRSDIPEDGRLEDSPRTTRILLRGRSREERRRFTLAHELGHLVMAEPAVFHQVHAMLDYEDLDLEQLCDAFAAELLMPRRWLVSEFEGHPETLDVVDELVRQANVSIAAALTRLAIVLRWRASLFYFERGRAWTPVAIAGRLRRTTGLSLASGTAAELNRLFGGGKPSGRPIELRIDRNAIRLKGQIRATRAGVLCLGHLGPS
ncbi:MAG TPA: ImmA/IrrE family metallo-endopeptidase [Solirubrobacteraceae bacterium]|jgi:hypothetical protein